MATTTAHGIEESVVDNATESERATGEVDRSLLRWSSLGLTPSERLRIAVRAGRIIVGLRRA